MLGMLAPAQSKMLRLTSYRYHSSSARGMPRVQVDGAACARRISLSRATATVADSWRSWCSVAQAIPDFLRELVAALVEQAQAE